MKRIARLIGLFSILMLFFAVAMVMSQRLLQRQTLRLREEAIARREAQLTATVELAGLGHPPWSAEAIERLCRALDADVRIAPAPAPTTSATPSTWQFLHQFGDASSTPAVLVTFDPPPAARLLEIYRRVATILLNLALGVIVLFAGYLLWSVRAREAVDESSSVDRDTARAGFDSLRQLASVSARQSDELEHERSERLRVEEDLNIKQLLLNRALEQKIRLGQDLHDGIIQALYATGLTLEAARPLVATDPAAAEERIAGTTRALNATIRDVRAYINGLAPDQLRRQTFAEAVGVLTRDLAAGRTVEFVVSIDESTATALPPETTTDLLQVVRESVSNGLRHGAASKVTVRLESASEKARLIVTDNGRGFVRTRLARPGHGLSNIESRVRRHGGSVAIESSPESGTTITCTLPLPAIRPA